METRKAVGILLVLLGLLGLGAIVLTSGFVQQKAAATGKQATTISEGSAIEYGQNIEEPMQKTADTAVPLRSVQGEAQGEAQGEDAFKETSQASISTESEAGASGLPASEQAEPLFGAEKSQGYAGEPFFSFSGLLRAGSVISVIVFMLIGFKLLLEPQQSTGLYRVLGSETRQKAIKALRKAPRTITDLSHLIGKSKSTISEHLELLLAEGLVEKEVKEGRKFVFYKLTHKGKELT